MCSTKIVNVTGQKCDIFIGRKRDSSLHFGNPFSSKGGGSFPVLDRDQAINYFGRWLRGDPHFKGVDPQRREWILDVYRTSGGVRDETFFQSG